MLKEKIMETDLFGLLASLIVEKNDDVPRRFEAQEDALKNLNCIEPSLGEWIDRADYPFLMETLNLSDAIFVEEFPGVRIGEAERKRFAETLEAHCQGCRKCSLKRGYDLEWESKVNNVLEENRDAISMVLGHSASQK